jgi:hypothetical protein
MNKEKLDQAIECLMDKIEKECKKEINNCESIFTLSKALTELTSARASLPV